MVARLLTALKELLHQCGIGIADQTQFLVSLI